MTSRGFNKLINGDSSGDDSYFSYQDPSKDEINLRMSSNNLYGRGWEDADEKAARA